MLFYCYLLCCISFEFLFLFIHSFYFPSTFAFLFITIYFSFLRLLDLIYLWEELLFVPFSECLEEGMHVVDTIQEHIIGEENEIR